MKLTYKLVAPEDLNSMESLILKTRGEGFGFFYCKGVLTINKQMPNITEIVEAAKALWEVQYLDYIGDALYDYLVTLAGVTPAKQLFSAWSQARADRQKEEAEANAAAWLDQVYQAATMDEWETVQGYDSDFLNALSSAIHRKHMAGDKRYENSSMEKTRALFLYAYRCGELAALAKA